MSAGTTVTDGKAAACVSCYKLRVDPPAYYSPAPDPFWADLRRALTWAAGGAIAFAGAYLAYSSFSSSSASSGPGDGERAADEDEGGEETAGAAE